MQRYFKKKGQLREDREARLVEVCSPLSGCGNGSDHAPRRTASWRKATARPKNELRTRLSENGPESRGQRSNASGLSPAVNCQIPLALVLPGSVSLLVHSLPGLLNGVARPPLRSGSTSIPTIPLGSSRSRNCACSQRPTGARPTSRGRTRCWRSSGGGATRRRATILPRTTVD